MRIVRERVYPERRGATDRVKREKWWQFERHAKEVVSALAELKHFFATPETSKYLAIAAIPARVLPSNGCVVFASSDWGLFASLQSSVHEAWARRPGMSKLETRPRYNPTLCFRTFPLPRLTKNLSATGENYHNVRSGIMLNRSEGLTETYNRFHDPQEQSQDIARLRSLHEEMDQAVVADYGWTDLDLCHGFQKTKHGARFTINESVRLTLLDRLLTLNHQRYEEQVRAGVHENNAKKSKRARQSPSSGTPTQGELIAPPQGDLFG